MDQKYSSNKNTGERLSPGMHALHKGKAFKVASMIIMDPISGSRVTVVATSAELHSA